jgi:hypothetical protein
MLKRATALAGVLLLVMAGSVSASTGKPFVVVKALRARLQQVR